MPLCATTLQLLQLLLQLLLLQLQLLTCDATHDCQAQVVVNPRQYADQAACSCHAADEDDSLWHEVEVGDEAEADASDDIRQAEDRHKERSAGLTYVTYRHTDDKRLRQTQY